MLGIDFLDIVRFHAKYLENIGLLGGLHTSSVLNIKEYVQGWPQALHDRDKDRKNMKVTAARAGDPKQSF